MLTGDNVATAASVPRRRASTMRRAACCRNKLAVPRSSSKHYGLTAMTAIASATLPRWRAEYRGYGARRHTRGIAAGGDLTTAAHPGIPGALSGEPMPCCGRVSCGLGNQDGLSGAGGCRRCQHVDGGITADMGQACWWWPNGFRRTKWRHLSHQGDDTKPGTEADRSGCKRLRCSGFRSSDPESGRNATLVAATAEGATALLLRPRRNRIRLQRLCRLLPHTGGRAAGSATPGHLADGLVGSVGVPCRFHGFTTDKRPEGADHRDCHVGTAAHHPQLGRGLVDDRWLSLKDLLPDVAT